MDDLNLIEILLVEDNAADAELTIRALKKQNLTNRLFWIEDGAEALDFLSCRGKFTQRNPGSFPKVILLDLKLPKVNGLEILKIIKADPITRAIPVVIMTSSKEDPDIKAAYALGANSFIVKPVDFDHFMHAVSNLGVYWLMLNQPPK